MATIPSKVSKRLSSGLKKFRPILEAARSRDIIEADTSTIVKEILAELFGYEKFDEITAEYMTPQGMYCDLAIRLGGKGTKPKLLIEVKAIGSPLTEAHTRQAVNYAAHEGVEWVVVTNALVWRVYEVIFGKPISQDLIFQFDLTSLNSKSRVDMDLLFPLSREGLKGSALRAVSDRRHATSRYNLAAIVLSDAVLTVLRSKLKKLSPDVRITKDELRAMLNQEVLKRDVTEGDQAEEARKKIAKVLKIKSKPAPVSKPDPHRVSETQGPDDSTIVS